MMIIKILYLTYYLTLIQVTIAQVWPHPQSVKATKNYLQIDSKKFTFTEKSLEKCDLLSAAIDRTKNVTFIQNCDKIDRNGEQNFYDTLFSVDNDVNYSGNLTGVTVEIGSCEQWPHLDMNENYTLVINATTREAYIKAPVIWGAIRGLETFSQLVANIGPNQFVVNETQISDFPRFAYRGILLDTARHYISVDKLYANLDAMAYNKLNVFHWHMIDDESFPYVSKVFPDLYLKGAFNPKTHVYTQQDIHNVNEYARQRGIRVVVEFDTPGHTLSWAMSHKELLTECYTNGTKNGNYGPIDPSNEKVYEFIEKLFAEVTQTFPDQYFHLGGDEVDFTCWESNPNIQQFMEKTKIKSYAKLEDYYILRVLDIMKKLNKSYTVWEEVFNNGVELKSDAVVHVWIGSWGDEHEKYWRPELFNVTSKGYRAILSSCWYLSLISFGSDWQKYYECEPHSFNGTDKQKALVIGGEAAVWGQYVNGANIISRSWPRASAVAERLWSPISLKYSSAAADRFHQQNCRMIERGLRVHPNEGAGYCRCDYLL